MTAVRLAVTLLLAIVFLAVRSSRPIFKNSSRISDLSPLETPTIVVSAALRYCFRAWGEESEEVPEECVGFKTLVK